MSRMLTDTPWFPSSPAESRSWVGQILQAGIQGFVDWFRLDDDDAFPGDTAAAVFGAAPRSMTGIITLGQTVDLVRLGIEVVESHVDEIVDPSDAPAVHAAVLRYAREVAFATAEVYARAAEARGAWDARLEALVVDSVLRAEADEAVASRASAPRAGPTAKVSQSFSGRCRTRASRTSSTRYAVWPMAPAWTRSAPPRVTDSW